MSVESGLKFCHDGLSGVDRPVYRANVAFTFPSYQYNTGSGMIMVYFSWVSGSDDAPISSHPSN